MAPEIRVPPWGLAADTWKQHPDLSTCGLFSRSLPACVGVWSVRGTDCPPGRWDTIWYTGGNGLSQNMDGNTDGLQGCGTGEQLAGRLQRNSKRWLLDS